MSELKIYDVTLNTSRGEVIVDGIYLTEAEGDFNDAIHMAIDLLRDDGFKGRIEYVSHSVN